MSAYGVLFLYIKIVIKMCIYNQVDKSEAQDHQNETSVNTETTNVKRIGFKRSDNRFLQIVTNESVLDSDFIIKDSKNSLVRAYDYIIQVKDGDGKQSYCPFVRLIEKQNGYYLKCFHMTLEEQYLTNISNELMQKFISLSPRKTTHDQKLDATTVVAVLTSRKATTEESLSLMIRIRDKVRLSFLEKGLMIAYMHPIHELGGVGKRGSTLPETPMYVAKIPLLMVRRMHKEDYVFMHTDDEKEAYAKYFGLIKTGCPFHKQQTND
jgi:hypothetical protein